MKVSIIMPCYNVEETIERALDSVFMQKVSFDFEVIVVDDASTDNTCTIVQNYIKLHKNLRIYKNEKNLGNAYSYYKGLCNADGEYFCVLDGDDYYTIPDKLQRQVDFLDKDERIEYIGTATYYIIDLGNGNVSIPERTNILEFNYVDFLTWNSGYYHTATYMYRNIFRGNVPTEFGEELYRGDTPRTMFYLRYSGKKIRVLDFVGSAYRFTLKGIWSKLSQKQQYRYQIHYQMKHRERVSSKFEKKVADKYIGHNIDLLKNAEDSVRKYQSISVEKALDNISKYAKTFAFKEREFVFQHAYFSPYLDTLIASLGYVDLMENPQDAQSRSIEKNVGIVIEALIPRGGGIFREISELIEIYKGKNVYLFVTDTVGDSTEIEKLLQRNPHLCILYPPENVESKLRWLRKKIIDISPNKIYYYCSHAGVYGNVLIQEGICKNIVPFSFDHGFLCGISNPNISYIIAKRSVDYCMLKEDFGEKVLFIPTWNHGAVGCESKKYRAFDSHDKLITASGAARYYKIDGCSPYRYIDYIIDMLKATRGKHVHFGTLPDHYLQEIHQKLSGCDLEDHFIYIPWSDNIPLDLLNYKVDLFIEPFPVVSYKLTLEALCIGVPVIVHSEFMRMKITDFIPRGSLEWKEKEDFLKTISSIKKEMLDSISKDAVEYFNRYHHIDTVKKKLITEQSFSLEQLIDGVDNRLLNIDESLRLFDNEFRISVGE